MLINSLEFIVFIAIVVLLYSIMPKKVKWLVLLIASYIFYFSNSTKLIIFIIITTLLIYFAALLMGDIDKKTKEKTQNIEDKDEKKKIKSKANKNKKWVLATAVLINLGILIFIKYSSFIGENINSLFKILKINATIPLTKYILPLGISYYTLQSISYIVDVYRQRIEPDKNLGRVALFVCFFPQMVEGPIGRYDKLANSLYQPHQITYKNLTFGIQLMIWGYFKKMVIADRAAIYVNYVFENYNEYSGIVIIFAIILYTLQIYAEFSGGIDIVRGVAQIFGIDLDQNFERPFFSKSIDEFWRRWNITLGTWLKDYVFYPVSLSKLSMKITSASGKKLKKSYLSKVIPLILPLLCVWLGNGFWHGAGWKYVVYGLYYYVIMMTGKLLSPVGNWLIKIFKMDTNKKQYHIWQIIRTTIFVCFGMLIFRADTLPIASQMFKSIFNLSHPELILDGKGNILGSLGIGDIIILVISTIALFIVSKHQEKGESIRENLSKKKTIQRWAILYAIMFVIIIFGIYGKGYDVQSFIYGQF